MSLRCPHCDTEITLRLAALARPSGLGLDVAALAAPVADIGVKAVGSEPQRSKPKQRKKNNYTPLFAEFWKVWPIHRDKEQAAKAFAAALRQGYDPDAIIAGAQDYGRWLKTTTTKPKYAQGWLNDKRWEDELDFPVEVGAINPAFILGTPEYDARVLAEEERAIAEMA